MDPQINPNLNLDTDKIEEEDNDKDNLITNEMVANNFQIDEPSRDRNDLDAFYNSHPRVRKIMQAVTVD